jgi:hypothetical protein
VIAALCTLLFVLLTTGYAYASGPQDQARPGELRSTPLFRIQFGKSSEPAKACPTSGEERREAAPESRAPVAEGRAPAVERRAPVAERRAAGRPVNQQRRRLTGSNQLARQLRPAPSRTSVLLIAAPEPPPLLTSISLLVPPAPVLQPAGSTEQRSTIDLSVLLWAAPLFVVSVGWPTWVAIRNHFGRRRVSLDTMRGFGDRFIAEFERPLYRRTSSDAAVKSRLRFSPSRHRLEVLLAPADGRTYPNLVDHRKNVEYDVERVERILGAEPFVGGSLYAEGAWVVIPFRFDTDRQQEGVP